MKITNLVGARAMSVHEHYRKREILRLVCLCVMCRKQEAENRGTGITCAAQQA